MLATARNPGLGPTAPSKTLVSWKELIRPVQPFLEEVSTNLAQQVDAFDPEIAAYARYALTNQGKQIRPALVALSGAAAGRLNDSLVTVAVIIEMVHLATLVHDDIMDEAEMRRRRPTLAANWGNEVSVLLGDCLFSHALCLAASFPTPEVCRAVAAATNVVCTGEILQTNQRRHFNLNRAEYFKALQMKTGELFALSCDLGAHLAGATPTARAAIREYGMALGTAYQLFDDCLDLFGSEEAVGKSLGTDLACGKLTLPILILLEQGTDSEQAQIKESIENWNPKNFPQIFELLARHNALNQSQTIIYQQIERAQEAVARVSQSENSQALVALGDYLAQQTDALGVCTGSHGHYDANGRPR
jgi:octaprenyl-diphosphate synthase